MDEGGCAFVDRSGELFAIILQFCRSKQRPAEVILAKYGQSLLDECEFHMGGDEGGISVARSPAPRRPHTSQAPLRFYGLDSLAVKIRGGTCPMDLLESDRRLRENESVARQDPKTYEKSMLIDVFGTETSPLARSSLELPRLLADVPSPTLQSTTILDFYDRLNTFSGELLQDLKDIPGLLWAGGAVIGALTGLHLF